MGVFPSIVTFLVIWWTVLFVVLPLGMGRQTGPGDSVPGADAGAPAQVDMPRKFALTTIIAGSLWLLAFAAASLGLFDLEAMSLAGLARSGA